MKRIRWVKSQDNGAPQARRTGVIEDNDDDLCAGWVAAGLAEYVEDQPTDAEVAKQDLETRERTVETRAVDEAPVDRAAKAKGKGK